MCFLFANRQKNMGLAAGQVAGIVVGALVVTFALCFCTVHFYVQSRLRHINVSLQKGQAEPSDEVRPIEPAMAQDTV